MIFPVAFPLLLGLLLLSLAVLVLVAALAGACACCVPGLLVVAGAHIAWAYAYLRITGQATA